MNEEQDSAASAEERATAATEAEESTVLIPPPRKRRRWWPWVVAIIVLLVLAALAYGGWRGWQWYQQDTQTRHAHLQKLEHAVQQAQSQTRNLQQHLQTAAKASDQARSQTARLQTRVDTLQQRLETLQNTVDGGRRGVQLAIVQQLLLLANDEVQVEHNPTAAGQALAAADRHLAALQDPRLFEVRKAVAQERSALSKVAQPDIDGAAIAISQMMGELASLPFRAAPHALPQKKAQTDDNNQNAWARGWSRVTQSLKALFHVHHHDKPVQPLLSHEQRQLVGAVFALRLDGARTALIRRNTPLYRTQIQAADQWLQRYYRQDAPSVKALHEQLTQLAQLDLSPQLPDITQSLELLRKQQNGTRQPPRQP